MVETAAAKRQKKGSISEDDVCSLLQRYPAQTVLTLLREVAEYAETKKNINWESVLNKMGAHRSLFKGPRDLQLLWRHLAYRQPLTPHKSDIPDPLLPLDDDSDLEFEVEAYPAFTPEATLEAANSVKVLASGSATDSCIPNSTTLEGDHLPSGHHSKISLDKQHARPLLHSSNGSLLVAGQNEGSDPNGSAHNARKKRKWSEEEDSKLIEGVRRWGEGNWSTILKEESKWGRTAGQLSQRWANLKKKQGSQNTVGASSIEQYASEEHEATRRAIEMALKNDVPTVGNGAAGRSTTKSANLKASNVESPVTNSTSPSKKQFSHVTNSAPSGSLPKPRPAIKKAPPKPPSVSDPIQRAAVAAGARIASASDADALRKAVQSKNASPLPPNVHFIRTGLVTTATGTASFANGGQQAKANPAKPSIPTAACIARSTPALTSERNNETSSGSANELQQLEDKTSVEIRVPGSGTKQIVGALLDNASLPRCSPKPLETSISSSPGTVVGLSKQKIVGGSQCLIAEKEHKLEVPKHVVGNPVPVNANENLSAVQGIVKERQEVLPSSDVQITKTSEVSNQVLGS